MPQSSEATNPQPLGPVPYLKVADELLDAVREGETGVHCEPPALQITIASWRQKRRDAFAGGDELWIILVCGCFHELKDRLLRWAIIPGWQGIGHFLLAEQGSEGGSERHESKGGKVKKFLRCAIDWSHRSPQFLLHETDSLFVHSLKWGRAFHAGILLRAMESTPLPAWIVQ